MEYVVDKRKMSVGQWWNDDDGKSYVLGENQSKYYFAIDLRFLKLHAP
jgi:hypothetical protein